MPVLTFSSPSLRRAGALLLSATLLSACVVAAMQTVGAFLVLRRRALTADAISHATLPGIAVAFIVMLGLGMTGKSLSGLLLGAYIAGMVAMVVIVLIRRTTRLQDDAAIGIVLSVFFGLGICLLSFIHIHRIDHGMPSKGGVIRIMFGQHLSECHEISAFAVKISHIDVDLWTECPDRVIKLVVT